MQEQRTTRSQGMLRAGGYVFPRTSAPVGYLIPDSQAWKHMHTSDTTQSEQAELTLTAITTTGSNNKTRGSMVGVGAKGRTGRGK